MLAIISYFDLYIMSNEILIGMVVFWIVFMMSDMLFTVRHTCLITHEGSWFFSFFLKKAKIQNAVALTIIVEVLIVVFAPLMLLHAMDFQTSAITSFAVGFVHISGMLQNKKFLRTHNT